MFSYIKNNQKNYEQQMTSICKFYGKMDILVILPIVLPPFTGGSIYLHEGTQGAMTYVSKPDLFLHLPVILKKLHENTIPQDIYSK